MRQKETSILIPDEVIMNKICFLRDQKVMLDQDLAELYQVETKRLKEQVKRNIERFPEKYMFELTEKEFAALRSQFATSKEGRGGTRYLPMVFTEHGVLQLSNVLKSSRAITVSFMIIDVFVKLREMLSNNMELRLEIEHIKKKVTNHDKNIELVFQYLDELLEKTEKEKKEPKPMPNPRKMIGYKISEER
ncbi:MAG: ORF6N domain-containing protein [Bacteroidia bacterium]|nr:ORF6N domain-containing protein [Bacteroidia bacterium]